jgi:hypothetical protein
MNVSVTPLTAIIVTAILSLVSTWILSFFMVVDNILGWIIFVISLMIGIFINYLVEKNDPGGGGM